MSDKRNLDSDPPSPRTSRQRGVPASALLLGYAGLIPFLLPPLLMALNGPTSLLSLKLLAAVQSYGAIILSFMGAIHWGLEMAERPVAPTFGRLLTSVSPALFAFFCLQLDSSRQSLWLLAGGFALLWFYDWSQRHASPAMPGWYLALRSPLTLGAIVGLLGASLL